MYIIGWLSRYWSKYNQSSRRFFFERKLETLCYLTSAQKYTRALKISAHDLFMHSKIITSTFENFTYICRNVYKIRQLINCEWTDEGMNERMKGWMKGLRESLLLLKAVDPDSPNVLCLRLQAAKDVFKYGRNTRFWLLQLMEDLKP
jgi:hypothetical protein